MSQSEENEPDNQVDQALADYMQQCDSGSTPDRASFLAQYSPELRDQLSNLLDAADWIEQLAGPSASDIAKLAVSAKTSEESPHSESLSNPLTEETLPLAGPSSRLEHTLPSHPQSLEFSIDSDGGPERELSQPALPCRFGEYSLERVLGRGGMGVVYFGHQVHLERPVAVKMIRSGALASGEEVQRFYAEARSAAKLDHPNIVTVYQCGEHQGHHYFSMDFVDGTDLDRLLKESPLDSKRAARYVRDVARAIQYAHDQGILHRDLKPANVLVDKNDSVRITDFGLAKTVGCETGLTATGAALGTPSYMSPEQAAGRVEEQHQATDIYSLGAILFTVVAGVPPFKGESVVQTLMHVIHRPAPRVRTINPKIPEDLETIIDVCLEKSPERRYSSAAALADDLDRFLVGAPLRARPVSRIRRAWYWMLGVPIFGAVLDHRVVEPTLAHRWVQRGLISAGLLLVLAWALMLIPSSVWYKNRLPRLVRIAGGVEGGEYNTVAGAIGTALSRNSGCKSEMLVTEGSSENIEMLRRGDAELALLQADVADHSSIAVVAPLYYEAVHILTRRDLLFLGVEDLKGRRIYVGGKKAGSRSTAKLLLNHAGLSMEDVEVVEGDWSVFSDENPVDAAILVTKVGATELKALLQSGRFQLMSMSNAWEFALEEPSFHPLKVDQFDYPDCGIPNEGIGTVATAAFLVGTTETPDVLVHEVLKNLYSASVVQSTGVLSAERAAHWQGIAWHPAARVFFQHYRGGAASFETTATKTYSDSSSDSESSAKKQLGGK